MGPLLRKGRAGREAWPPNELLSHVLGSSGGQGRNPEACMLHPHCHTGFPGIKFLQTSPGTANTILILEMRKPRVTETIA